MTYRKHVITILIALLEILSLAGCSDSNALKSITGSAQGTTYNISFWSSSPVDQTALEKEIVAEFATIDASMSSYRKDSTIEQFNAQENTDPQRVDADIVMLVQHARTINVASNGCYDLTIKPLFDLWGFRNEQFAVPAPTAVKNLLANIGMDKLEVVDKTHLRKIIPALKIDLASIGQGYSVMRIAGLLEQRNIHHYLVEIGGELVVKGNKPGGESWRVGVEKPIPGQRTVEKIITIAHTHPVAVMTSGTYRHFYDAQGIRYSHILDARTGFPVSHVTVSVTVLHSDPTLADAWSTALLCLGKEAGVEVANAQGIAALFIEQIADELKESTSIPLQKFSGAHIQ